VNPAGNGVGRRGGLALCAAMATCYWSGAHPQPGGPPDASPLSAAPIRRLTNAEYDNTVRDLLGDTTRPAEKFPTDVQSGGLVNDARTQTTSAALEKRYLDAAQGLAHAANGQFDGWLACSAIETRRDCALRFVKTFGRRAWRRPLSADESARLMSVYDAAPDATRGLERVIASLLISPDFLYRPERDIATTANMMKGPFEIATRLSYFLWATTPSDALLDLAEQGKLSTREQVGGAARWMLVDARAHEGLRTIIFSWLGLSEVATRAPTAVDPPELTTAVRASMEMETARFIDWVLWASDGRLSTLLTAPRTFVDAQVATLYGVPAPADGASTLIDLDPNQRSGVLTQPSLLWINSTPAPILRGKFVREQLLCQPLPNPPPDVPPAPILLPSQTNRQNLEAHRRSPACNGCHSQMDPIGFGFESYDSIGRYRTIDRGQPVDASGNLTGTDNDGQFVGVPDLARRLAVSQTVRQCVAKQFFRMALGRFELASDAPSLAGVNDAFASGDLRELAIAITTTDAFLGKKAP